MTLEALYVLISRVRKFSALRLLQHDQEGLKDAAAKQHNEHLHAWVHGYDSHGRWRPALAAAALTDIRKVRRAAAARRAEASAKDKEAKRREAKARRDEARNARAAAKVAQQRSTTPAAASSMRHRMGDAEAAEAMDMDVSTHSTP